MKKKISLIILTISVILFVTIFIFMIFSNNPLKKYDFTNCRVGIYDYEGTEILEYLSDEECSKFINVLQHVEISTVGTTDFQKYSGRHKNYCIELENQQSVDVSCVGNYLVIGELGYEMTAEEAAKTRSFLNVYWEQLFKELYSIIE